MTTTVVPRQRDPVARAVLLTLAGAVVWLGITQPGMPAQAEPTRAILIITPTPGLPAAQPPAALVPPAAPTAEIAPVVELAAPTQEPPQVVYQQVVVEVPAPAPPPEVVYVPVQSEPQAEAPAAPEAAPQTLLEIEQAAAEAHKDLPTLQCPCGNDAPNYHPMPRGAGSR